MCVFCDISCVILSPYLRNKEINSTEYKQEVIIMNKNIIIRTVIEGLIGWVLLALVVTFAKDITFAQALFAPHTLVMASAGFIGGYIGLRRRAQKQANI